MRRLLMLSWPLLALVACDDEKVSAIAPPNQLGRDAAVDPDDGVPAPDRGVRPDQGVDPDDGVERDARVIPDMAPDPDDGVPPPDAAPDPDAAPLPLEGETIGEHAGRTCFNEGDDTPDEILDGLVNQLINAINCVQPGTLSDIPDGNWQMLDPRRPALIDGRAVDDLIRATEERDVPLVIRWAYRDVSLQHLFYLWTLKDCDFAARPGRSNHQDGLAIDINDWDDWREALGRHGWVDNIPGDRPHFNYTRAEDLGLGPLSLVAFQALWNLNVPQRPLALTGNYDTPTADALSDSPMRGFPLSLCDDPFPVAPTVGQAAWNGCDLPPSVVEALSVQIAEVLNCAAPGSLVPLNLCAGAGCVTVVGPPKPEWLEARTHAAVIAASERAGEPVPLSWGWRDPALGWFLTVANERHGCGDPVPPSENPHSEGRVIELGPDASQAVRDALVAEGFVRDGARYRFVGGADLTALGALAYQRLWNANRAEQLAEDGRIGPATRAALDLAPPSGFADTPCEAGGPEPGPALIECIEGCFNQTCPGTYDFCTTAYGRCEEVLCDVDDDCAGLQACDDPARGSNPVFYCDDGRCRRR